MWGPETGRETSASSGDAYSHLRLTKVFVLRLKTPGHPNTRLTLYLGGGVGYRIAGKGSLRSNTETPSYRRGQNVYSFDPEYPQVPENILEYRDLTVSPPTLVQSLTSGRDRICVKSFREGVTLG